MKRKQSIDENAAAPPRKILITGPALVDLADELVTLVFSYFHFYERSKYLSVCRRFMSAIDAMPPLKDSCLEIIIKGRDEQDEDEDRHRPLWKVTCDRDKSVVRARFNSPEDEQSESRDRDSNSDFDLIMSGIPSFKTVRPGKLVVRSTMKDGVDIRFLSHLAINVGKTVTDLTIHSLGEASAVELQNVFLKFGENGKVSKVSLSTLFPLARAVSAIVFLPELVSIKLLLRKEMMPKDLDDVGLCLCSLSQLARLKVLDLEVNGTAMVQSVASFDDSVTASFILGCASLVRLESLFCDIFQDRGAETQKSLALMLGRLPLLKYLGIVFNLGPETWKEINDVGGHKNLQKLDLFVDGMSAEVVDSIVAAFITDFTALNEVNLQFLDMRCTLNEALHSLGGLKSHKSLSTLRIGWKDTLDTGIDIPSFQEAIGGRIRVEEFPMY